MKKMNKKMNKMNTLVPAMLVAAACSATSAQVVDFVFVVDGAFNLTTMTLTDPGTGLSLTIDNPRDNTFNGNNTFARTLGGLFIDGGIAPTVDWTFSQDVKLVEYELGNQDNIDLFDLVQGGVSSLGNTTITVSTFAFTNTSDTFVGGVPIVLTTSDHNGSGYSFARIRVELAAPSLIGDDYIANVLVNGPVVLTNNDTALLGPDAIGNWEGSIGYDVEADTITVSSLLNLSTWVDDLAFEFLDLDFLPAGVEIVGVSVINAAGAAWDQIDDSDVSFTANSVRIDASEIGGAAISLDQTVTVQLITGPAAPPCPGDIADDFGTIGADGMVSFGDFLALLGLVGPCPGGVPGCDGDIADDFGTLGADGMVSFGDFLALLGLVGPCP